LWAGRIGSLLTSTGRLSSAGNVIGKRVRVPDTSAGVVNSSEYTEPARLWIRQRSRTRARPLDRPDDRIASWGKPAPFEAARLRLFYHKLWAAKKSQPPLCEKPGFGFSTIPARSPQSHPPEWPNFGKVIQLADTGKKAEGHKRSSPYLWAGFVIAGSGK
jgi:hypothetical protein